MRIKAAVTYEKGAPFKINEAQAESDAGKCIKTVLRME